MKQFVLSLLLIVLTVNVNAQMSIGNPSDVDGLLDGWPSNMIIDRTNMYTNSSGGPEEVTVDTFNFFAGTGAMDPITPFVVLVNDVDQGDYTVMIVGTPRTNAEYTAGAENTFAFNDSETKSFILSNGSTMAIGYLDANANGTGGGTKAVVSYAHGGSVYYSGGGNGSASGSVAEGEAPTEGTGATYVNFGRTYSFNMEFTIEAAPLSTENDILSFSIGINQDSVVIDTANHTVVVAAAYGTDISNLSPELEVSSFASVSPESGADIDLSSPVTYTVIAENGDEQNWIVTVNVSAVEILVTGISIEPETTVVNSNETVQITASLEPANASNRVVTWSSSDTSIATVDQDGLVTGVAKGTVIITATSDDSGFDAECLVEVVIAGINFDPETLFEGIEFKIGDTVQVGVTYDAGAEDLSKDIWYNLDIVDETGTNVSTWLRRTNAWGKAGNESSFGARAGSASLHYDLSSNGGDELIPSVDLPAGHKYVFTMAFDRENGSNIDLSSYSTGITFYLTDAYSSNDITDFSMAEQSEETVIDTDNHTIEIEVANGTDLTNLTPTITVSKDATVNPASGVAQDFSSAFTYTVTADNGDEQVWTVTVTEDLGICTESNILAFTFPEQTGNAIIDTSNHTVNIEVDYGSNLTNLTPNIIVSEDAIINPASEVAQDFSTAFTYTVTAENGDEQEWNITVSIGNPKTDNDITTFSFIEQTGDAAINTDNHAVSIEVMNGSDLTSLIPAITISEDATIDPASGIAHDFSSAFNYTVTAENGDEQLWIVTVTEAKALSSENSIKTFSFAEQTGDAVIIARNHTVNIEVTDGSTLTNLTPAITVSEGASINPASGVAHDFTSAFTYTVTAENGDKQEWIITVTVADETGINDTEFDNGVYPNPAVDVINVSQLTPNITEIEIINLQGMKKVKSATHGVIDISDLAPGIYFIKISERQLVRFIKE